MRHIYLHVPFCRRRCTYCDFAIAVRKAVPAARFVEAVRAELRLRRDAGEWDEEPIETLYLGGGTPSLVPSDVLANLIAHLLAPPTGRAHQPAELTLEVNPEDVTADAARAWVKAGVTRVSLGVQSFDDRVLQWMHRPHDATAPATAMRVLRRAGVRAVSIDLIFGLPDDLAADFSRTLSAGLALEPDHLSVYGLTAEPRTPYARLLERQAARAVSDERYAEEFLLVHDRLTGAGYRHYEVSNYARPGHESRHNQAYWTGRTYAGLGPSAHRYRSPERSWNVGPWAAYDRRVAAGLDPTDAREVLDPSQQRLERVYLGLRTLEGVAAEDLRAFSAERIREQALARRWLEPSQGRIRATPAGWLRLDELVSALTTSPESG